MEEKVTFNKEIKYIKQCDNFKELLNEIKKTFNIDDKYDNKIEIKTESEDEINDQDDFDNLIPDEYPPLIIYIENYKENKATLNNNTSDNNILDKNIQNNKQNTINFEQNNLLKEIGKIIETQFEKNIESQFEKIIDKKIKNIDNTFKKLTIQLNNNNKMNDSKFSDFGIKIEKLENNLNSYINNKVAESVQINENNNKIIEKYKTQLQEKDMIIFKLNQKIEMSVKELTEKDNNLSKIESDKYKIEEQYENLKKKLDNHKIEFEKNNEKIIFENQSLLKKYKKLEDDLKNLHESYTKTSEQLKSKNNEIENYKNEIKKLKKENENREKEEKEKREKEERENRENRERELKEKRERELKEKREKEEREKREKEEKENRERELKEKREKEKRERELKEKREKEKREREQKEKERLENIPYEGKFVKNEYIIEKKKEDLNENSNIECDFKIKNISKEKAWKKGFVLKMKYKNKDDIYILDGQIIEEEVLPNSSIEKTITFYINNKDINNYILDIYLCDDKKNIIQNCSTKLNINIIDNENKFNFELDDKDFEEIYKNLSDDYNVGNIGVTIDTVKKLSVEYSKICDKNIPKEEFIDALTAYIIENIY